MEHFLLALHARPATRAALERTLMGARTASQENIQISTGCSIANHAQQGSMRISPKAQSAKRAMLASSPPRTKPPAKLAWQVSTQKRGIRHAPNAHKGNAQAVVLMHATHALVVHLQTRAEPNVSNVLLVMRQLQEAKSVQVVPLAGVQPTGAISARFAQLAPRRRKRATFARCARLGHLPK